MISEDIWDAAELLAEWTGECEVYGEMTYILYRVPREAIDEDQDDDQPAYLLHGTDSGNVRRLESMIDPCFRRLEDVEPPVRAILAGGPEAAAPVRALFAAEGSA